jgi:hypothetical protein
VKIEEDSGRKYQLLDVFFSRVSSSLKYQPYPDRAPAYYTSPYTRDLHILH